MKITGTQCTNSSCEGYQEYFGATLNCIVKRFQDGLNFSIFLEGVRGLPCQHFSLTVFYNIGI